MAVQKSFTARFSGYGPMVFPEAYMMLDNFQYAKLSSQFIYNIVVWKDRVTRDDFTTQTVALATAQAAWLTGQAALNANVIAENDSSDTIIAKQAARNTAELAMAQAQIPVRNAQAALADLAAVG